MKKKFLFFVIIVFSALLAGMFVVRQVHLRKCEQNRAEDEAFRRAHEDRAPPRDYKDWNDEFGKNEHDPSTPEGQAAIKGEQARIPEAKERLRRLLNTLPAVYASEDDAEEQAFIVELFQALDGFGRASCAEMLTSIHWGCSSKELKTLVETLDSSRAAVAVGRYYRIRCKLVDLLWTRGGLECEAAEADAWVYSSLRDCRRLTLQRKLDAVGTVIDAYLEDWKESRCDSESSNFCRAHRYWEDRYRLYYEERIKRGETNWLKILSGRYRYQLKLARGVLKREPRWSPDYNQ